MRWIFWLGGIAITSGCLASSTSDFRETAVLLTGGAPPPIVSSSSSRLSLGFLRAAAF
jgi:hypothetical protein